MAGGENLYVFAFEGDNEAPLAAFLEQQAVRLQRGLYEAILSADFAAETIVRLREMVELGDRLRIYSVPLDMGTVETIGGAPPPEAGRFWIL